MKFTILQNVIEIVYFFTFNHSNTLEDNEIQNINHCKYIDRAKATQNKLNHYFLISNIQKSSVALLCTPTNIYIHLTNFYIIWE